LIRNSCPIELNLAELALRHLIFITKVYLKSTQALSFMRKLFLALLFIRLGLFSFPTLARWPIVPISLLPNSSIILRYDVVTSTLSIKNAKSATIKRLTLSPTDSPAQILLSGHSALTSNFTPIFSDANSQTASGTMSVTVMSFNSSPTTRGIPNQTAETPTSFSISVSGLANRLSYLSPSTITGVSSTTADSPLNLREKATYSLGLSAETSFQLGISSVRGCISMYSLKAGSWTDISVWSCGRLPIETDVVTLNHAVYLPPDYQGQALQILYTPTGKLFLDKNSSLRLRGSY